MHLVSYLNRKIINNNSIWLLWNPLLQFFSIWTVSFYFQHYTKFLTRSWNWPPNGPFLRIGTKKSTYNIIFKWNIWEKKNSSYCNFGFAKITRFNENNKVLKLLAQKHVKPRISVIKVSLKWPLLAPLPTPIKLIFENLRF